MAPLITLIVFKILLPILLFIGIYLGYMELRGLFQSSGLGAREVGLLIVGSIIGSVSSIPIFITPNYLLALNVGGALVPLVLAFYFLKNKALMLAALGVLATALTTFLVTSFEPGVGVVAEIPQCFIPVLIAIVISFIVYGREVTKGAPFGYAIATLGTIIGADLFRLPELFFQGGFVGAIGGAGVYDLVFISGLLAMCVIFLAASKSARKLPRSYPEEELVKLRIKNHFGHAKSLLAQVRYQASLASAYNAVVEKIEWLTKKSEIQEEDLVRKLETLRVEPLGISNFLVLSQAVKRLDLSSYDCELGIRVAEELVEELNELEKRKFASLGARTGAFLIDLPIIITILITTLGLGALLGLYTLADILKLETSWAVAWLMLAWVLQLLYFTAFETLFHASPGKLILKTKVLNEDFTKLDFLGAFTRNVVRFLDLILLYIPSVIMIALTNKGQRIGDYVARTVVVSK